MPQDKPQKIEFSSRYLRLEARRNYCYCGSIDCKAQMKRGTVPFRIDRISWDAIPVWVCEQCGESLFET